jgi:deferrochelatase/peroxidase EfeB
MSHALVTIVAGVSGNDIRTLREKIEALGNPAGGAIKKALDDTGVIHFASLHALKAASGPDGHLILEFSGDGEESALLDQFGKGDLETLLTPIFEHADGFMTAGNLAEFLKSKAHALKQGYFSTVGLGFAGAPGMSVARIRKERDLVHHVGGMLPGQYNPKSPSSALAILTDIRRRIREDKQWEWALTAEPTPLLGPEKTKGIPIGGIALAGIKTFLWPVLLIMLAAAILTIWLSRSLTWLLAVEAVIVLATLGVAGFIAYKLRQMENADLADDRNPDAEHYADITERENIAAQNHLCVQSVMKAGWVRRYLIRLSFFTIGQMAAKKYRPGFLDTLGTIHFARWILVPGTGDLLFFSNYGGSWESYLEDFITKAHGGLTAVWSNTLGYPRTEWLVNKGATDGERFKRWARGQQQATLFWYTAYDDITTSGIRTNAAIRQGLAAAQTEDEARHWLSLFGSAPRPSDVLETKEIQCLLYGGLKSLPYAKCLLFRWSDRAGAAAEWLRAVKKGVSFGDMQPKRDALVLGLTPSALSKLNLPESAISTFPNVFQQGMVAPVRSRVLGDYGANDPDNWWWGKKGQEIDGVALLYCKTQDVLNEEVAAFVEKLEASQGTIVREVPLSPLVPGEHKEPFGFADGVSQPIIQGTFMAKRNPDPLNLVAAGEFILGYPDNRGYFPPTPSVEATSDPDNLLPLVPGSRDPQTAFSNTVVEAPRDLGRNGTFLVLRQLEQDVKRFQEETERLTDELDAEKDWVAAKMIGRWPNGSSLVRNPTFPARLKDGDHHATLATLSAVPASGAGNAAPSPVDANPVPSPVADSATQQLIVPNSPQPPEDTPTACPVAHFDMGPKPDAKPEPRPDNDFLYGRDDAQGLRCPFGAHIRRANPRDSFTPGSQEQIDISNRHRILRRGRLYTPQGEQKPGLMFACFNADLERQFEFIQQTWVNNTSFHGLNGEMDPLLSSGEKDRCSFTIPMPHGSPIRLTGLSSFVTVRGGGYFFVPGRRTLEYLAMERVGPRSPVPE